MRPLLLALLVTAAPASAQSIAIPTLDPVPRVSGEGFGSALAGAGLSASLRHVADGNPAALPGEHGVALGYRRDVPISWKQRYQPADGALFEVRNEQRYAASNAPADAGAVWTRDAVRVGLGYRRTVDERYQTGTSASEARSHRHAALHKASLSLAVALPVPGVGRVVPGARVGWLAYDVQEAWSRSAAAAVRTDTRMTGAAWAAGVAVEPEALPVRAGVFYEGRARLAGPASRACTPVETCSESTFEHTATTELPARLEASVGGSAGPFSWDATLARVFWQDLYANTPSSMAQVAVNVWEGSANARYALRPGLVLALGVSQQNRMPFRPGMVFSTLDDARARLLLVGATYTRGPLVFDASFVNGGLLSQNDVRLYLGSVGAGYRF